MITSRAGEEMNKISNISSEDEEIIAGI